MQTEHVIREGKHVRPRHADGSMYLLPQVDFLDEVGGVSGAADAATRKRQSRLPCSAPTATTKACFSSLVMLGASGDVLLDHCEGVPPNKVVIILAISTPYRDLRGP